MGKYLEQAKALRNDETVHYNCAQAVTWAFSEATGLSREWSQKVAANFGSGMKRGGTCGAITGGLMVLGLLGKDDGPTVAAYHKAFRDNHQGCLECADLLRINQNQGCEKKCHCDGMVYEAVERIESLLEEKE